MHMTTFNLIQSFIICSSRILKNFFNDFFFNHLPFITELFYYHMFCTFICLLHFDQDKHHEIYLKSIMKHYLLGKDKHSYFTIF